MRNQFVDIETGEDIYEKLLGKRITIQKLMENLTYRRSNNNSFRKSKELFYNDWNISGLWYSEGFKYMLTLGKHFKRYLFKDGIYYVYEIIPTEDTHIFEVDMYEKIKDEEDVTFSQVFKSFDGFNYNTLDKSECFYDKKYVNKCINEGAEFFGCFWELKQGFKVNLLYKCVKHECIDKENDIWKFSFIKNIDETKNLTLEPEDRKYAFNHVTGFSEADSILKSEYLIPNSIMYEDGFDSVFLGFTSSNNKMPLDSSMYKDGITFIFSYKLYKNFKDVEYFNLDWNFGKITNNTIYYNSKQDLPDNLYYLDFLMNYKKKKNKTDGRNELVIRDSIPLDKYLIGIIYKENKKYMKIIDKIKKDNPKYKDYWLNDNPFLRDKLKNLIDFKKFGLN